MAGKLSVTLRVEGAATPIVITPGDSFASEAMRWSYIARNRDRWTGGIDPGQGDSGPLHPYLDRGQLQRIADARLVEVVIPSFRDEATGWALRIFPWEYALSAATRPLRSGPMTIVRHLQVRGASGDGVSLARPATLESAPGRLASWYDVQGEGSLMLSSLGADPAAALRLQGPTRSTVAPWFAKEQPSLVHIAGVDAHQAVSLLGLENMFPPSTLRDGLALQPLDDASPVDLVDAETLAGMVCAGAAKPELVMCNVYNSASRIAARMVAKGARFAIGYQDVIEDSLAAIFCSALYRSLAATQGDMLEAFKDAMAALRRQPGHLRGACIVLWSSVSLLQARVQGAQRGRLETRADAAGTPPWQRIRVERQPREQLNYSLLHNRQSPFRMLQVYRNNVHGLVRDIQVTVDLNAGDSASPFRMTFDLADGEDGRDLTNQIVLPLTSALIRTQSERIQSSLRLLVTCEGQVVKEDTFRVGLSPVDEWQDGEKEEWQWLPSFVLPRDPAVARIIDTAQGVLCALADDPAAGFDGYQSVDATAGTDAERYGCVDKQVRAIWYALLNMHGLSYINPPPSYGHFTQRLRTPGQVLAERRGTCIDLALLLAACLEYVDIYPVLFLLTGHAFVGYWRSEELHAQFRKMQGLEDVFGGREAGSESAMSGTASAASTSGYVLVGQTPYQEVRQRIFQQHLVPLEATWLTSRGSFDDAANEGRANLRRFSEFQAMIDVRLARNLGVTPIPLLGSAP